MDFNRIPFIEARYYTLLDPVIQIREPRVIVIHSMEAPEKGDTAESVARYFRNMADGRKASAHYCIDADSIVQCVQCNSVAYGAPGMNALGIHLEHAGYGRQTFAQWTDDYSQKMLRLSAELCARVLIPKFHIKPRWLTPGEIRDVKSNRGISGFCTHKDITVALKTKGGHSDPGSEFPRNWYLQCVITAMEKYK